MAVGVSRDLSVVPPRAAPSDGNFEPANIGGWQQSNQETFRHQLPTRSLAASGRSCVYPNKIPRWCFGGIRISRQLGTVGDLRLSFTLILLYSPGSTLKSSIGSFLLTLFFTANFGFFFQLGVAETTRWLIVSQHPSV